jgi:hypothetical protein
MARLENSYAVGVGLQPTLPPPVIATAAPGASNIKFPLGQVWLDINNGQSYILNNINSGSATWNLMAPGASDVDTVTGDSGGALSPSGGNITIAGGTNITTVGSGSTITVNLDAAIVLATSVTAPLYTAGAGVDLDMTVPTGQNMVIKMGDAAGSNKVSFTDSADSEVALVDSDGNMTIDGNLILNTVATQIQMNGGAVTDFIGQATLVSGTVTIANTNIASGDRIMLTRADANSSSALGELTITAQTASTSFVITALDPSDGSSTITGDVSIVNYVIIRQN